jgi:hypothetical protein
MKTLELAPIPRDIAAALFASALLGVPGAAAASACLGAAARRDAIRDIARAADLLKPRAARRRR